MRTGWPSRQKLEICSTAGPDTVAAMTTGMLIDLIGVRLDGLAAGDRVATEGSFKLRQGSLVQVADGKAAGS